MMLEGVFLSEPEITAAFDRAVKYARGLLPTDSVTPTIIVTTRDAPGSPVAQTCCVVADDFNEHEDKHRLLNRLGQKFYREKKIPVLVVLISEAWRSKNKNLQPRDDPEREEGLTIFSLSMRQQCWHAYIPVMRDSQNRMIA